MWCFLVQGGHFYLEHVATVTACLGFDSKGKGENVGGGRWGLVKTGSEGVCDDGIGDTIWYRQKLNMVNS